MKIAITASGKELDSEVDPRFGRAGYFIVYDTDDGSYSAVDNKQNVNAPQGAGIQAGQTVVNFGAAVLLTGNCGPKAFDVLSSAGVKVYLGASGTVQEAIAAFEAGRLAQADAANKNGHWM
jgi:predicted Fe-Mo cluster-binding NifX family protein